MRTTLFYGSNPITAHILNFDGIRNPPPGYHQTESIDADRDRNPDNFGPCKRGTAPMIDIDVCV